MIEKSHEILKSNNETLRSYSGCPKVKVGNLAYFGGSLITSISNNLKNSSLIPFRP